MEIFFKDREQFCTHYLFSCFTKWKPKIKIQIYQATFKLFLLYWALLKFTFLIQNVTILQRTENKESGNVKDFILLIFWIRKRLKKEHLLWIYFYENNAKD